MFAENGNFSKKGKNILNIDSKAVLYSKGKNDECETQEYAVLPILEYLSTDSPFDKGALKWQ